MMFTNVLGLVATATVGLGASLQQVSSWGANPTKIQMFIYVPDKLAASPPVVVAVSPPFTAGAPPPSSAD
jgi:acetylxylan esterase